MTGEPNGSPDFPISHFEGGIKTAVGVEFPDTKRWGSYFHFPQSIYRKVQSLGLKKPYEEYRNLKKFIRKTLSGFFVLTSDGSKDGETLWFANNLITTEISRN